MIFSLVIQLCRNDLLLWLKENMMSGKKYYRQNFCLACNIPYQKAEVELKEFSELLCRDDCFSSVSDTESVSKHHIGVCGDCMQDQED